MNRKTIRNECDVTSQLSCGEISNHPIRRTCNLALKAKNGLLFVESATGASMLEEIVCEERGESLLVRIPGVSRLSSS